MAAVGINKDQSPEPLPNLFPSFLENQKPFFPQAC